MNATAPRLRIVSLVPSSTETLLDHGADVVACTKYCEQPDLVHVGGTKNPDVDAIVALRPDVVVMDEEENRRADADALQAAGIEIYVSKVRSLDDAASATVDLARLAGVDLPAAPPSAAQRDSAPRRSAFVPIWRRPWMSINADTYAASLLGALGVSLVTADHAATYPTVELDVIAARRPDLVLVPSEPYEFSDAHVDELRHAIDAAVVRVDGRDLFWWGSRTAAARERLARELR